MAKKAKAKKKKAPGKYMVCSSECGSVSQLCVDDDRRFSSPSDARAFVQKELDNRNYTPDYTYFIVAIEDVGRPSQLKWGAPIK